MNNKLDTFWERRQLNREIVGKIVELPIYEEHADKKVKGTFLIIFTDDLNYAGLQLLKLDLGTTFDFPVFNGELTHGEKNYHYQKRLAFKNQKKVTRAMRVLNLEALGGIVDVDLEHIHIFSKDTPFTNKKQIDGNSFDDILHSFFANPVDEVMADRIVDEIYRQFN